MIRMICGAALAAVIAFVGATSIAQATGVGAKYASREPHTCASRTAPASGPITAAQAKQYFQCDTEKLATSSGDDMTLTLVTGLNVQVGAGRPFMMNSDNTGNNVDDGIDPHFTVYPIRGSFTHYTCHTLTAFNSGVGRNCLKQEMPHATGICFMSSFKEWHCHMQDISQPMTNHQPAPRTD